MNSVERPAFRQGSPVARAGGASLSAMKSRFRTRRRGVMVTAHRGHWDPAPENSLAAIRAANGWDAIQIDIRVDRFGTPFLMHDQNLLRMTGQMVDASDVTPDDRRAFRLRSGAGGAHQAATDERIPTLEEAFAVLEGTPAFFDLDVKRREDLETVAATVASLGCQDRAALKVEVQSVDDVATALELERRYDIMVVAGIQLRAKADLALIVALREADIAAVEAGFHDVNLLASAAAFASDLIHFGTTTLNTRHHCGLSDNLALSNPRATWGRLTAAGIRRIMTDEPQALSRFLLTR